MAPLFPKTGPTQERVIIVATAIGDGKFAASRGDRLLVAATRMPLLDGARVLLADGIDPRAVLVLRHAGSTTDALTARLGEAARLSVEESAFGPVFRPFREATAAPVDRAPVRRRLPAGLGHPRRDGAAP